MSNDQHRPDMSNNPGWLRTRVDNQQRQIDRERGRISAHTAWLVFAFVWLVVLSFFTARANAQCADLDFNNDGVYPSDQDTTDFSNVLAGADCPTCDSIDFNGDGVFPDERDYTDWLAVLAGGPCSNGGFTPVVCPGCPEYVVEGNGERIGDVLRRIPRVAGAPGVAAGTPAIISVRWSPTAKDDAINWTGMDGMAYGGVAGRPLIIRGIPGPNGERPTLRIPSGLGAGVRIVGGLQHVQIRGLRLVGDGHGAIVAIQGNAGNVLVEDCEVVGGALGISIQGMGSQVGPVRIRRNIIRDQRHPVSHSQAIYTAGDTMTVIEENVLYNNGNRDQFSHGMYLVHTAGATRIVTHNWIISPGSACIQARGGDFTIQSNVCYDFNTGIGTGHPMAFNANDATRTVWTSAIVSNNLLDSPRAGQPAQWGISYMLGKPTIIAGNIQRAVPRPWMPSTAQGGDVARVPVGEVTIGENDVKPNKTDENWESIIRVLLSRPANVWGEQYETGGVIERAKQK
jgi:hypothetical protein